MIRCAKKYRSTVRTHWYIIVPCALTIIFVLYLALLFGPWLSIDTVSYFKVAEYYAAFDIEKAINGAWSPLLSWLLVPAVWLSIDLTLAIRILHVILVLALIIPLSLFIMKNTKGHGLPVYHKWAIASMLTAAGITLSWWAMKDTTPDFLSAVVAVYTLLLAWCLYRYPSRKTGMLLGVTLGLLFFAKFAAVIICVYILAILGLSLFAKKETRVKRKKFLQGLGIASAILFAALIVWSLAMYQKYGEFALSSTSSFNFALNGPNANGFQQIDYPNKILPVPYADSVTPWDDPVGIPPKSWSLKGNEGYYLRHIGETFIGFVWLFLTMSPLVYIGYIGIRQKRTRVIGVLLLGCVLAVAIGYSFYHVWERFIYIALVPWIAYATISVGMVRELKRWIAVAIIVCSSFAMFDIAHKTITVQSSALYMHSFMSMRSDVATIVPQKSRVAVQSLELISYCYYLQVQCPALNYKLTDTAATNSVLIERLRADGVRYYITRTPVASGEVALLGQYSRPSIYRCIVGGELYGCGGAYVLVYAIR